MATVAELRAQHPEWNVVAVTDAPGGGQWAVGADGGVFALGGAAYGGSYTGLAATDRQGTRSFTGITADSGGYTLTSDQPGQTYHFNTPAQTATTTPAPATPPAGTIDANSPANLSAKGLIASTLVAVGLPASLADSLWNDNYLKQGRPLQTIIDVDLPASDAFKAKFPAFDHFQAQTGGTVKDYMSTVDSYAGAMKAAGLPAGFYDTPDDFAKFITGNVSPKEVSDRIQLASQAALSAPPEVHDFLVNQEGLSPTDLAAFFLDPTRGDLVAAKARYTQAEIGGAAKHSGFGDLSLAEATKLQAGGTTGAEAGQRFGVLSQEAGLFQANVDEAATGGGVGRGDALAAAGNAGDAINKIAATKAARQAKFEGGGGAGGASGTGNTGLGSSR